MRELTHAELVWNRACGGRRLRELAGDRSLADLIGAHGLVMNGGVLHAVERAVEDRQLDAAIAGYRFYGMEAVAELLVDAEAIWRGGKDLGEQERSLDRRYQALIPSDGALVERFERHFREAPAEYAPLRPGDEHYWP